MIPSPARSRFSPRGLPLALAALTLAAPLLSPGPVRAQLRTLQEALERAVEVHPSLARARAAADAAASGVDGARGALFPTLAVRGSGIRFQEPMLVAPLHRFDPTAVPDFDETLLQGTLGMDWTLFDGGRRGAGVDAARARASVTDEGVREAEAVVLQRTAEAYLSVLTARERVAAQDRHQAALEAERDRSARLVTEGAAPELELLRAEAELASARAEREAGRQALRLALDPLARLLDLPADQVEAGALTPPPLPGEPPPPTPSTDTLLAGAPTVAAARGQMAAAEAELAVARSAWLPTLSAAGGYNLFAGGGVSPVAEWQGGLQLSYPLLTGGSRGSAVDASRASLRQARARVEEVAEEAALAADAARAAEVEARARVEALEAAVSRFAELARVERLALEEGVGMQSDWLRAEAGLLQARAGLAEARHRVVSARIAWARATGRLDLRGITELLEVAP
ncbi:MAG TPA: TolC family protein [Longimicrobiales bacterium]|nr:TolC family protein [Longimicrobiales bacterium]